MILFEIIKKGVSKLNEILNKPEEKSPENLSYLEYLVDKFKTSEKRERQLEGDRYYKGEHDILQRKKFMFDKNGNKVELKNVINLKRIDNQYAKAVDQKINYMLGRPPVITSENDKLNELIEPIFNFDFMKKMKNLLKDSLNGGVGYLYVYIDPNTGELKFKRLKPSEVKIIWADSEKTEMEFAFRVYADTVYSNGKESTVEYVEVYDKEKITRYKLKGKSLTLIESTYYINDNNGGAYSWGGIVPIIAFKYNDDEIPLINRVKSLQDGINEILSDFNNNMQEDARTSILVLKNYAGTNLEEFRRNLATYGAVKVTSDGGVETLTVNVNAGNYQVLYALLKNALIENAKCFDAKDDRLSGNPNQMNIQSMYSDIDIDCNGIETEYKASFEMLVRFIKMYLSSTKQNVFSDKDTIEIIFNKDVLINESQVVGDIVNSVGLLSNQTLVEQHPYIHDVTKELERIEEERSTFDINYTEEYSNSVGASYEE